MVLKKILKTISFKTEDSHYLLFLSFGSAHLVWITVKSIRHQVWPELNIMALSPRHA